MSPADELDLEQFDRDPTGMRDRLAALPDPGPMPGDVSDRILAALAAEHAGRATVTQDASAAGEGAPEVPAPMEVGIEPIGSPLESGSVIPFDARRKSRSRKFVVAAAGVAAAGALGFSLNSGLLSDVLNRESHRATAAESAVTSGAGKEQSGGAADTASSADAMVSSGADYQAASLSAQVVDRLTGTALTALSAAPSASRETQRGLRNCLAGLGIRADRIVADVASFDARPAVIVLAERAGARTAYVVGRGCTGAQTDLLAGPVAIP